MGRNGTRKEVALPQIAGVRTQELPLIVRFASLRDHAQSQRVRERDHRLRNRRVAAALLDPADERAVDLEAVDRQSREIAQARIARAEVVHRDLHAEGLQALEDQDRLVAIVDEHALGKLQLEPAWFEPRRPQSPGNGFEEVRAAELLRRNVHGEPEPGEPGFVPGFDLAASSNEHEFTEWMDEIAVLRDQDELQRRNPPALAVPPADQSLHPDSAPGGEIDLGLVVDFQLVSSQR